MRADDFDQDGFLKLRPRDGHIIYSNEPENGNGYILLFSEGFLEKINGQEGLRELFNLNTIDNKSVPVKAIVGKAAENPSKTVVLDLKI